MGTCSVLLYGISWSNETEPEFEEPYLPNLKNADYTGLSGKEYDKKIKDAGLDYGEHGFFGYGQWWYIGFKPTEKRGSDGTNCPCPGDYFRVAGLVEDPEKAEIIRNFAKDVLKLKNPPEPTWIVVTQVDS